jgi:hypothetical protein
VATALRKREHDSNRAQVIFGKRVIDQNRSKHIENGVFPGQQPIKIALKGQPEPAMGIVN